MNIQKYLKRIQLDHAPLPSLEALKKLQQQHLYHIPFENLDIHYDRPIKLDLQRIYEKVILKKRGGFCYELNGLFYELLSFLGFELFRISARVYSQGKKNYSPEFSHLALVVNIEDQAYLADVGFGRFSMAPLKLALDEHQKNHQGEFKIDLFENKYLRVNRLENQTWIPEYIFEKIPRNFGDYQGMCHYFQTDPESHFRKKKMITKPTEKGRITLTSDELKITKAGNSKEIPILDETHFDQALWEHFQIKMH